MNNKSINNILIIRFRRIGDSVISSVLCSTLRKSFPDARIDYVLDENIGPLFENHKDINKIITFSKEEQKNVWKYLTKIRRIIKEGKYDLIVDTRATVKTLMFSLFSLSTRYRVGRKKYYNIFQNYQSELNSDIHPDFDEVKMMLQLLKPLEKNFNLKYVNDFKLFVEENDKISFRNYMIEKGIDFNRPVIICSIVTRVNIKRWDVENLKKVLWLMINNYNAQLIFNYAPEEKTHALELHDQMNKNPNVFTDIEAKGLKQLVALVSNVDFYFGNEGGVRHIAQALGVPNFAIYPPTVSKKVWLPNPDEKNQGIEPKDIYPLQELEKLPFEEQLKCIGPEDVWIRLQPMLEKIHSHHSASS